MQEGEAEADMQMQMHACRPQVGARMSVSQYGESRMTFEEGGES